MQRRRLSLILVVCLGLGGVLAWLCWPRDLPIEERLDRARRAFAAGEFETAVSEAERVLAVGPKSGTGEAALIAGLAEMQRDRPEEAVPFLERAIEGATGENDIERPALAGLGPCLERLGRARDAEQAYRRAIELDEDAPRDALILLLVREGRTWDAMPHVRHEIRSGRFAPQLLLLTANTDEMPEVEAAFVERCLRAVPDDPLPALNLARDHLDHDRLEAARELLQEIVTATNHVEAHAWLGVALVRLGRFDALPRWHAGLPTEADEHPRIWSIRADWARHDGQVRAAARCLWESVRLDPNHQATMVRLAAVLAELEVDRVELFRRRAELLVELETKIRWNKRKLDPSLLPDVPRLLERLGRPWEAGAWYALAGRANPGLEWAREGWEHVQSEIGPHGEETGWTANPARRVDLSDYPLPNWPKPADPTEVSPAPEVVASGRIRLRDVAESVGLGFRYVHDAEENGRIEYMSEFDGGGVAVLDYDRDGNPDLYFTQGTPWPRSAAGPNPIDQLFRNTGTSFEVVTDESRIVEDRYSQGVAVGDVDQDGFPDLYVANVGGNRLFLNNGDGTFEDATEAFGVAGNAWSSSCAFADLSGNGLPDLYVVNYLAAESLEGCPAEAECAATTFAAAQDRLYLNAGTGRFRNVTDDVGIVSTTGKGLGLVVGDLDGTGRSSVFVANDTTANFLYVNEAEPGTPPRFAERALLYGLGVDEDGVTQSCMGIAAGDANGDGRIDLFVTNFDGEPNALYLANDDGTFDDSVRSAGLRGPGLHMLGWGTQFLDADLDGDEDLVVANGHVLPFGVDHAMRAQCFENVGSRFVEIDDPGAYFGRKLLGRSLARLDWNRDGRLDVVVSHLDAPVALLENESEVVGGSVTVRLVGTRSARDAIGSRIVVRSGGTERTAWLVAGDGFQASNDRSLVLTTGRGDDVHVTVHWPSGTRQEFPGITPGGEYTLVEGRPALRTPNTD